LHHTLPHPTQWTPPTDTATRRSHNGWQMGPKCICC